MPPGSSVLRNGTRESISRKSIGGFVYANICGSLRDKWIYTLMAIYIYKNNQQHGPYAENTVQEWLRNGQCSPADHGRREDQKEWHPLGSLFFGAAPPVPVSPAQSFAPPAAYDNSQMSFVK